MSDQGQRAMSSSRSLEEFACPADFVGYSLRLAWVIASELAAIREVVEEIVRLAWETGFESDQIDSIELAVHEALVNAMTHGNRGDSSKMIFVCGLSNPKDKLVIAITDEGDGFDPRTVNDPCHSDRLFATHGRGIFLMRQFMDEVRFEVGGRRVVLTKSRYPLPWFRAANPRS